MMSKRKIIIFDPISGKRKTVEAKVEDKGKIQPVLGITFRSQTMAKRVRAKSAAQNTTSKYLASGDRTEKTLGNVLCNL